MSDRNDASGSGAETTPEPPSSQNGGRAEEADRQGETWLNRLRAVVGLRSSSIREELEDALEDEQVLAGFSPEERVLLHNALELREVRVADIMVPRAEVDAVDADTTIGELLVEFRENGHSRMPVYRESLDDPLGMVHIKDLLAHLVGAATTMPAGEEGGIELDLRKVALTTTIAAAGLVREVLFVPPSMPVATLLATMQSSRMQMALVIDEYGGTDGVVSIEDAVETVVGEIEDEHDEEEVLIVPEADGVFVADGRAELEDVAEKIGPELTSVQSGEDIDTVGGLVFSLLGRIPSVGETVDGPAGYKFEILETDPRRISRVRIFKPGFGPPEPLPQDRPAAFG